jgi:4-alpha-glucanotransferase
MPTDCQQPRPEGSEIAGSLADALQRLGFDYFAIQIHDASFPSDPREDCGRGSPYSLGAERFFQFAAGMGFNTVQLGPQGLTLRGNGSPYDSTLFSRNPLNLPLAKLVDAGRLSAKTLDRIRLTNPEPDEIQWGLPHHQVHDRYQIALDEVLANARADRRDREDAQEYLEQHAEWLVPDALYQVLCQEHGALWWRHWSKTSQARFDQRLFAPAPADRTQATQRVDDLKKQYHQDLLDYALVQRLLEREHEALRQRLQGLGLALLADLQVGLSPLDIWARQDLFHPEYLVGAPPSRTNIEGQPWGYCVLDPNLYGTPENPGPALQFVQARLQKVLRECDGVRIDHPQGWIDPWVYRADDPDPLRGVQQGARFRSSPAEPRHPGLAHLAIARGDQLDPAQLPYADRRVVSLDDDQVAQYSVLIDIIARGVPPRAGRSRAIACEILSTYPYQVERVLRRYSLGRFRVVQKANLELRTDVYRIENAQGQDWIMLGTHDTPTIWELADRWNQSTELERWRRYLRDLKKDLGLPNQEPSETATPGQLVHEIFSMMLSSRARQLALFFPDLFGIQERYNQPGVVSENNWRLRLPADFERRHAQGIKAGRALDLVQCILATVDRLSSMHAARVNPQAGTNIG